MAKVTQEFLEKMKSNAIPKLDQDCMLFLTQALRKKIGKTDNSNKSKNNAFYEKDSLNLMPKDLIEKATIIKRVIAILTPHYDDNSNKKNINAIKGNKSVLDELANQNTAAKATDLDESKIDKNTRFSPYAKFFKSNSLFEAAKQRFNSMLTTKQRDKQNISGTFNIFDDFKTDKTYFNQMGNRPFYSSKAYDTNNKNLTVNQNFHQTINTENPAVAANITQHTIFGGLDNALLQASIQNM